MSDALALIRSEVFPTHDVWKFVPESDHHSIVAAGDNVIFGFTQENKNQAVTQLKVSCGLPEAPEGYTRVVQDGSIESPITVWKKGVFLNQDKRSDYVTLSDVLDKVKRYGSVINVSYKHHYEIGRDRTYLKQGFISHYAFAWNTISYEPKTAKAKLSREKSAKLRSFKLGHIPHRFVCHCTLLIYGYMLSVPTAKPSIPTYEGKISFDVGRSRANSSYLYKVAYTRANHLKFMPRLRRSAKWKKKLAEIMPYMPATALNFTKLPKHEQTCTRLLLNEMRKCGIPNSNKVTLPNGKSNSDS